MKDRPKDDLSLRKVRSAITNGSTLVADCDGRSAWMRRLRDITRAHIADLAGEDQISHAERVLINRSSMLTLQLEMLDTKFAEQDGVATPRQIDRYQRVVNTLRRTLETLGLQRRSRDVTPSVDEFLASEGYKRGAAMEVE